ncbi:MAG: glycosyltransferase family 39 protein, partial [Planctomycetota bacterium]
AVVTLAALHLLVATFPGEPRGLLQEVFPTPGFAGEALVTRVDPRVEIDESVLEGAGLTRDFGIRWSGVWFVPRTGIYEIRGGADDRMVFKIDGDVVLQRDAALGLGSVTEQVYLERGLHRLEILFEQLSGTYHFKVGWAPEAATPRSFGSAVVFPAGADFSLTAEIRLERLRQAFVWAWGILALGVFWAVSLRQRDRGWPLWDAVVARVCRWRRQLATSSRRDPRVRPIVVLLMLVIVLYAALLRAEALIGWHGPVADLALGEEAQVRLQNRAASLSPTEFRWQRALVPYGRGDPSVYIRFARDMESFYAAHAREPLFVFSTKVFVNALGDQDVGVSFASIFYSLLLVWATYLLGAFCCARWVGLAAALAVASEHTVILWSVQGWRDDAFAFLVVLWTFALMRLWHRPRVSAALLVGFIGGAACLTRITSFSFLLPGLGAFILFPWRTGSRQPVDQAHSTRRHRLRCAAVAALLIAILVGPYMFNCWRVFGDPLWSINHATEFYRERAGIEAETRMDTGSYLRMLARDAPIQFIDTALNGLTTYPFNNKWDGFRPWSPVLAVILEVASVLGLALFLWRGWGRRLLMVLGAALLPYAFTWRIAGGAEWRFTLYAYPFFLIAAFWAAHQVARFGWLLSREDFSFTRLEQRALLHRIAATMALGLIPWAVLLQLPHLALWEDLKAGRVANVRAGPRDQRYFVSGWHPAVEGPNVTARFSRAGPSLVRVPMLAGNDHRITLRLHPYPGAAPQEVAVSVNGVPVADFELVWDPNRVGSYTIHVPARIVREEGNLIELRGSRVTRVPAQSASAFALPGQEVGFLLWYVNV